jgi:predicted amidohydrolase YtcJ
MNRPLLALLALLSSPGWADTLVTNVNGVQAGSDGQLQHFTGLIVADDGKVRTVLTGPPPPIQFTDSIDGHGRTLLPGLIDAHGHVIDSPGGDMGLGLTMLQLDLSGTSSIADLQRRLAAYAQANPGSGWILGRGWNQELWPDKRFPTASDLDAAVADRPVLLARVDGHAAVANSAGLRAAGITSAASDPQGGRIERDDAGKPTGLFIDNAIALVAGKIAPPTSDAMDRGLEKAEDFLLSNGITTVADMGTSKASWEAMQRRGASGRLRIRFIAYADGSQPLAVGNPTGWLFSDRLRMAGVKLYADGALGSRGAFLKQPYADKPDTRGLSFLSDAQLREQAESAAWRGFQLAVHAIGDAANAQVITVYEALSKTYGTDRRWRIEHFQIVDPADIPRLAPAGIIASMQPTHQTSDRLMAEKRLGRDRLAGAYAWQSALRSGARIAFGSDFPVESPNPFPGLAAAVSRQDMNGQPPGGWLPAERVSFARALSGFSRDAAYAGFAEDKIGALEPGKWADFILVDRDVSTVDPQALARTQVLETWVAGKKVWERAPTAVQPERGK